MCRPAVELSPADPNNQHVGRTSGRSIAQFERPGYEALKALAQHPDPEIRSRVIVGLSDVAGLAKDRNLRKEAVDLLKRCLETESDETLRRHLQVYIEVAERKKG
jgi:HEAT repeat protein